MDKWVKKLSGVVIASVLALTLSSKAFADEDNNPSGPPADAPGVSEEVSGSDTENTEETGESAKKGNNPNAPADNGDSGDGTGSGDPIIPSQDPAGSEGNPEGSDLPPAVDAGNAEGDEGNNPPPADDPGEGGADAGDENVDCSYINIDGDVIDPEEPDVQYNGVGPVTDEPTGGYWGYDAGETDAVSDDSLYMKDWNAGTIEAHNCDLHIVSAGVNQIGTIDAKYGGDVYVAGTGIMLIDEVRLNEDKGFYLQPIEGLYDSGTVAVFVRTDAACLDTLAHDIEDLSSYTSVSYSSEGTPYILVNGSMVGILDGDYVIPDGIDLIMPKGSRIEMMSPGSFKNEGGESVDLPEDPEHYSVGDACSQTFLSSSSLTIPTSSSFIIGDGATLDLSGRDITAPLTVSKETITYAPVLNAEGNLVNNGSITGKGIVMRSTHKEAPAVPNYLEAKPEYAKPDLPDAAGSTIGSDIFVIYRWNDDIVRFSDLDYELYDYLSNSKDIDDAEFAAITSNDLDYSGEGSERWGIHTPLFSFRTSTMDSGTLRRYNDSDPIYVNGNVYSFQTMFSIESSAANWLSSVFRFQWGIETLGIGSGDFEDDFITGSTGSGKLGSGAGDYKGDMDKSKLIFGTGKSSDDPGGGTTANHSLILKVTDKQDHYNLSAYLDGKQIFALGSKVTVRFDFPVPASEGRLFVVFRNEDGTLTAFAAAYDSAAGQLVFRGDKLGDFVVVCINYDGEPYSKEFYDYLETLESVKNLQHAF